LRLLEAFVGSDDDASWLARLHKDSPQTPSLENISERVIEVIYVHCRAGSLEKCFFSNATSRSQTR
jgi:hypothetical protein